MLICFAPGLSSYDASFAVAAPADVPRYAGHTLLDALADLQARGLALIYSSDVVRPDMIVTSAPASTSPRLMLDELIAAHGLVARPGPHDTLLIVRVPPAASSTAAASTAADAGAPPAPGAGLPSRTPRLRVDDVIVTSKGDEPPQRQPEETTSIRGEELRRDATLGDDVNRAVARQPGAAAGDVSSQLFVRGGAGDEFSVVLDGLEIREPFHLTHFLSPSGIVDANAVDSAELTTGNFPAEFGNSMSGIVSLSSLTPSDKPQYSFGASTISSRLLADGRFNGDDGAWVVSARTWYPDATVDLVDPGVEDMNPTFHDLFGKAQMRLGEGTVISGNLLISGDNIDFTGEGHAQVAQARSASRYAWLTVKSVLSPKLLSETMVSSGGIESNREGSLGSGPAFTAWVDDRRSFNFFGLKQDWSFQGSDRHLLRGGLSAEHGTAEYDYFNQPAPPDPLFGGDPSVVPGPQPRLSLQPSGYTFGAYIADRYQIAAPLTLDLGLRWDKQTYAPDRQISPRVNLVYALGRSSALRAGWGRFYQAQGLNELQVEDGVSRFAPAQMADHAMLGFEHFFRQGLSFRLDAYRKQMSQLRPRYENLFNPIELFPEVEPDRIRIAPQRAEARGFELSLRQERPTGISWWASYALASAQDQIDAQWVPRSWDQTHTFNFGVSYRRGDAWDLTLAGVYHSGWPTTGVTAEMVANPDGSQSFQPILGPRNAERYPAFHRLDFKVRRHLNFGRGRLSLFAEITNLYNRDNICCAKNFNFTPRADGSVQVDRVDGFWLQQVPVFGLEWESAP